jgi:hypothetical protein
MFRKIAQIATLAGALMAFAVPAAAQGEALITDSEGAPAAEVTALSTNTTWMTAVGAFQCTTTHLELALTEDTTTAAQGHGSGAAKGNVKAIPRTHTGTCGTIFGLPIHITSLSVSQFELNASGTGTVALSYTYDMTYPGIEPIHCVFDGTTEVTWTPNSDQITIEGILSSTRLFPCPNQGAITGTFTVTDEAGKPVVIH